jgi:integrase
MTIVPRNGRFGVKVWDAGTKRHRWLGSFDTEDEARRVENDARPVAEALTVEQWGRVWLAEYPREALATQRTYRYAVRQITAELGRRRLSEVDRLMARRIANTWPRGTTRIARTMWADAVRDGLCELNPWTNLRLETPKGRKDLTALTEAEIGELADLAERVSGEYGPTVRAIVMTLAYTGVRPGEVCALRRSDLDAAQRELVVRYSVDGTGVEKAPKNGKPRIVTVPPVALEAIRRMPAVLGDDYLFHTARGRRLNKGSLSYVWRPIAKAWSQLGGREIDLYELRHAAATLFLERGATPADVAVQLGHQDGGRLVQVLYGHPAEDRARERLRSIFSTAKNI